MTCTGNRRLRRRTQIQFAAKEYKEHKSLNHDDNLRDHMEDLELNSQFTGVRFADADNTQKVKSFFILSFSVSKKFKTGITCFAYIDNLLNRKYVVIQGFPMPGFSFTGGLKAEF